MQLKKIIAIFLAAALILSVPAILVGAENINSFEVGVVTETTAPVSSYPVIYNSGEEEIGRSTRLNSSHIATSRMPSSA